MAAESHADRSAFLAVRFVDARAMAYRTLDEYRRQLRKLHIDPDTVVVLSPESLNLDDPPPNSILANDPGWMSFHQAWSDYQKLKSEWEIAAKVFEKEFGQWEEAEGKEIRRLEDDCKDCDISLDEAGQPNKPQEHQRYQKYLRYYEQYNRKRSKWIARLAEPKIPVPDGWEGQLPYYEIKTFDDVEPWLERSLALVRDTRGFSGDVARDHGVETVRNFFRLCLKPWMPKPPNRPDDLSKSTFHQVEVAVMDLLIWVRDRLVGEEDDQTSEVSNDPEPTGKRGRKRQNSQLDDAVAAALNSEKYKDAKDIADNCPEVRGLLKGTPNPVRAVRDAMRRIRSARVRDKKRARKGN